MNNYQDSVESLNFLFHEQVDPTVILDFQAVFKSKALNWSYLAFNKPCLK